MATVYTVEDLVNDPQVIDRDIITTVEDDQLGPVKMQNVMFRMSETPGDIAFPGRDLGADNDEIYVKEFGHDLGRLRDLKDGGVL